MARPICRIGLFAEEDGPAASWGGVSVTANWTPAARECSPYGAVETTQAPRTLGCRKSGVL